MIAILSPHYDDAVFSCWHVLRSSPLVLVVNVFTGEPPPGAPPGFWDRETEAADPRRRLRERREEDRAALALAGRDAVDLGFLDAQHRAQAPPASDIAAATAPLVTGCEVVYAPAGIGGHPDHLLVNAAAQLLSPPLRLYADLPHAMGTAWVDQVQGLRSLEPAERELKVASLRAYQTQLAALERLFALSMTDERTWRYEAAWAPAAASAARSSQSGTPPAASGACASAARAFSA